MNHEKSQFVLDHISPAAGGPLYRQIVEAVKRAVSEGRLAPGQALPSFRELAEQLLVSLITVKRAYEELEHEGIIYRRQGLGTFIAEQGFERSRRAKREESRRLLTEALREALEAGLNEDEVLAMIHEILQRK